MERSRSVIQNGSFFAILSIAMKKLSIVVLCISFSFLGSSCASLRHPDITAEKITRLRYDTPQELSPVWTEIDSGLLYLRAYIRKPGIQIHALKIELENPAIEIHVGPQALSDGHVLSTRVSSFARQQGSIIAVNANPFSPSNAHEGEDRQVTGIAVSNGNLIAGPDPRYAALVFYKDGRTKILEQRELKNEDLGTIWNAVGGFFIVLQNGHAEAADKARHPRTGAGLSDDGKTLYLLVIDGRRIGSIGATELEAAQIFAALGADNALLLDGGGSSALAIRTYKGKIEIVNVPIHSGIPGWERAVSICLAVCPGTY